MHSGGTYSHSKVISTCTEQFASNLVMKILGGGGGGSSPPCMNPSTRDGYR